MQCMHCLEHFTEIKHWDEIIAAFKKTMKSKKGTGSIEQLKAFINTSLGEVLEERVDGEQVGHSI